jgi:hypothetical protein
MPRTTSCSVTDRVISCAVAVESAPAPCSARAASRSAGPSVGSASLLPKGGAVAVVEPAQVESGRHRVALERVPRGQQAGRRVVGGPQPRDLGRERRVLARLELRRQRPVAVPVSEQQQKVEVGREPQAAVDLVAADLDGAVLVGRLVADAPAQVDDLELPADLGAPPAEAREDVGLQRVALGGHVVKRRAHKEPHQPLRAHSGRQAGRGQRDRRRAARAAARLVG